MPTDRTGAGKEGRKQASKQERKKERKKERKDGAGIRYHYDPDTKDNIQYYI